MPHQHSTTVLWGLNQTGKKKTLRQMQKRSGKNSRHLYSSRGMEELCNAPCLFSRNKMAIKKDTDPQTLCHIKHQQYMKYNNIQF